MTISASHAINFNHIMASQGLQTGNAASGAGSQTSDFDHILASQGLRTSNAGPSNGQQTSQGTVSSSKNGDGTFNKTTEEVNGKKVIDMTVTYADGKTKDVERSITVNADGSKTITKTNANGKTSTIESSKSRDADGNLVVAREVTNAKGNTTDSTISVSKSATGEVDRDVSRTNAKGETETLDRVTSNANGVRTVTTTGTGYNGQAIDNEMTWTTVV